MHIKDAAVSEKHGILKWSEEGWVLTDCGSSNGTLVNGERLTPSGVKRGFTQFVSANGC